MTSEPPLGHETAPGDSEGGGDELAYAEPLDHPVDQLTAEQQDDEWLRLDKRKLLLDPINAVKSSIFPIAAVLFGVSSLGDLWWVLAAPVVVSVIALLGLIPWFTTTYRITPTQFQLRKGLLHKTTSTAPLDRIRSVDLEATLLHRLLGMRKVQIGTGVDAERIELDAVTTARADELRTLLMTARSRAQAQARTGSVADAGAAPQGVQLTRPLPGGPPTAGETTDAAAPSDAFVGHPPSPTPEPEQVLAVFNWSWARFAPFNLARLAIVAAAIGVFFQFFSEINIDSAEIADSAKAALRIGVALLIVVTIVGLIVGWLVISVSGYLLQWWGLRLTRSDGSLNMTAGLLTTRSISVEEKRVRGVELVEPLLMRAVNGAHLSTLATGVGEGGTTAILPHCPTPVATHVAADVLGDATPLRMSLVRHGSAARRRRHIRQQWGTIFLVVVGLVLHQFVLPFTDVEPAWWLFVPAAAWLVIGVGLAELSYAHLGHALTDDHLIAGHGITARRRTVLEVDGIIGWVYDQSFFQRRAGLLTLHATTAAGNEKVTLTDVPEHLAVQLSRVSTPDPVVPFLAA